MGYATPPIRWPDRTRSLPEVVKSVLERRPGGVLCRVLPAAVLRGGSMSGLDLTDEQRQRLRSEGTSGPAPGSIDGPVAAGSDHPITVDARDHLAERYAEGKRYTKAKHLATALDVGARQAGMALRRLEAEGRVEKWAANSSTGHTYEILPP